MSPHSNRSRNQRQSKSVGQVRIVAGQWRGRKLPVPDVDGLRPTGDRVRETVFNWLQTHVAGSHCLDLFAGSGALGFEALSRFAASVTFVEPNIVAYSQLERSARMLGGEARLEAATAEQFLVLNTQQFDIVFIDPPFDHAVQWKVLQTLLPKHVAASALVYIEAPVLQSLPSELPPGCVLHREKIFGEVSARLFKISY